MSDQRDRSSRRKSAVLVLVANLPVRRDRRVWQECQALLAAGREVSVICPRAAGDPDYQQLSGVHIYSYPPPPPARGLAGFALEFLWCWLHSARLSLRVRREVGFAVLQACNPPDTFWLLARLWRLRGVRFVYDQHDLCPEIYQSRFADGSALVLRALRWLELQSYRAADEVVAPNASYREVAISRGRVSPARVTVVRSGPSRQMCPGQPVSRWRAGRSHLAAYVGVMGPQDGVDVAVRTMAEVVHTFGRTDVQAVLCGDGDCLPELRALATTLGVDPYVTFTGWADDRLLTEVLSTADVGLCPDPHSPLNDASTMNKVLEYMAFGLPMVSTALPETVVSAGSAALYAASGDPRAHARVMLELLDDAEHRTRLGELGRRRLRASLAWEHQVPAYLSVFDRLTGPAGARGQQSVIDLAARDAARDQDVARKESVRIA